MRPALLAALLLAGCGDLVTFEEPAQTVERPRPLETAKLLTQITDVRVRESSGVAVSPSRDDVFYTLNDSGNQAVIYQFDSRGQVTNALALSGAENRDWEDLATATVDGRPYLFVADIGDNAARRDSVRIYRVPEGESTVDAEYPLRYAEGPQDAECLLVTPGAEAFYIITKRAKKRANVYRGEFRKGMQTIAKVGELDLPGTLGPARQVTGGAISPDGSQIVLRTYLGAYAFPNGERWWQAEPRALEMPLILQSEAIAFNRSGDALLVTGEGSPCPVYRVPFAER